MLCFFIFTLSLNPFVCQMAWENIEAIALWMLLSATNKNIWGETRILKEKKAYIDWNPVRSWVALFTSAQCCGFVLPAREACAEWKPLEPMEEQSSLSLLSFNFLTPLLNGYCDYQRQGEVPKEKKIEVASAFYAFNGFPRLWRWATVFRV